MIRLLVIVFVWSLGGPAAADQTVAQRHYKTGMAAYALEDYDGAIREFETGFREEPQAAFLYNIAQAHRMAKRPARALHFYQRYLELSPSDRGDRAEVEKLIAELQQVVATQERAAAAAPITTLSPRPVDLWAVGLGAAGTVVLGTGAGLAGYSASLDGRANSILEDLDQRRAAWDRANALWPVGYTALAVGGVLLVASVVKYLSYRAHREAPHAGGSL